MTGIPLSIVFQKLLTTHFKREKNEKGREADFVAPILLTYEKFEVVQYGVGIPLMPLTFA